MHPTFSAILLSMVSFTTLVSAQNTGNEPSQLTTARARYDQEMRTAADPVRDRYAQSLDTLKKTFLAQGNTVGAEAVQREFTRLGLLPNRPPGFIKEAKIIIWNQHNAFYNDRGTNTVNVALIDGGKEVWRRNDIHIPWTTDKDTNVEVSVPHISADKVRVELTDLVNNQGGLAEIEYWWDGRNLAKGRRVEVSAVWENNQKCGASTLTDGITTSKDHQVGYWCTPNRQPGWAEVSLAVRD